jgi:hypothetical protein
LLAANHELLVPFSLVHIVADSAISPHGLLAHLPVQFEALEADAREVADALYLSYNDEVILEFKASSNRASLSVKFDNPEFNLRFKER